MSKHEFIWDGRGERGEDARYSILSGRAASDLRLNGLHFRILAHLGRFNHKRGWCRLSQADLAAMFEVRRQSVNKVMHDLIGWEYMEMRDQKTSRESFCLYRSIIEGVSPKADTPRVRGVSPKADTGVAQGRTRVSPPRTPNKEHIEHIDQERGAKARPRARFVLSADWKLPDAWHAWATKESLEHAHMIEADAKKFKAHWRGKQRACTESEWEAEWQKWFLRTAEQPARAHKGNPKSAGGQWDFGVTVRDTSKPWKEEYAEYRARQAKVACEGR